MRVELEWKRQDDALYLCEHVGEFEQGTVKGRIACGLPDRTFLLVDIEEPERRRYVLSTRPAIEALVGQVSDETP